ncbi:uncharacterized protein LOC120686051 isoform X2 [Panicum virgatum]|uniref:uncharacterized protein LOC120686051 isoform X2 n=1 Tax=Panicum virgatum TaxID=38727 RepID=UPI0019D677B1|nr:uncharacterized protein LOC120686051 isoform X2 [Panicum virgatum]
MSSLCMLISLSVPLIWRRGARDSKLSSAEATNVGSIKIQTSSTTFQKNGRLPKPPNLLQSTGPRRRTVRPNGQQQDPEELFGKKKKQKKDAAETTPSQSSTVIHGPKEASTMADVGASLHEEGLPDWMSQLFEKLDLEVYEDSISTGEMAQVGTYHIAEGGISSEIYGKSKGKDSTMDVDGLHEEDPSSDWISLLFGKSGLEANEDCIRSAGKVAQVETPPLVEGAVFSEIDRSSEKDSTILKSGGAS